MLPFLPAPHPLLLLLLLHTTLGSIVFLSVHLSQSHQANPLTALLETAHDGLAEIMVSSTQTRARTNIASTIFYY